jgi:ice-binding like protein/Big-like domain-containing protein
MKTEVNWCKSLTLAAAFATLVLAACNGHESNLPVTPPTTTGTLASTAVSSTSPANGTIGAGTSSKITVNFSTPIAAATLIPANFTLTPSGSAAVAGTISYDAVNNIATFVPSVPLGANTLYTATLTTGVTDQTGNALAASYAWSFTTGSGPDTSAPQIISTAPANASVGVPVNSKITAVFSKTLDASTVTASNFTVAAGFATVAGNLTYSGTTATFTPSSSLTAGTTYTVTVTGALADLAGNALANGAYSWSFTAGGASNATTPAVTVSFPANQTIGVVLNQAVAASFSGPMDASTITTASFTLVQAGGAAVPGTVAAAGNAAVFTPAASLTANTNYVATITPAVKDLTGNALAASFVWSFTTGTSVSTILPAVLSTTPASGATGVALNQTINATFNEPMNPLTINNLTVTLAAPGGSAVAGIVNYSPVSGIATFVPSGNLQPNSIYTFNVSTAVTDLTGTVLPVAQTASFTTGAATSTVPVNLRSLATFAAVAGAGLVSSNLPSQTTINGNVALSPAVTCTGDGVSCSAIDPVINGTLYANDSGGVAFAAQTDLVSAIGDASARQSGVSVSDITGMTLTPGVYSSRSTVSVAAGGTVTFDAKGDANAVWIIQAGTALTVNSGVQIVLINGARPGNIFWQVGGAATIGNSVNFSGNVLAIGAISVGTGSTVAGRLMTTTGQLTLVANTVTRP